MPLPDVGPSRALLANERRILDHREKRKRRRDSVLRLLWLFAADSGVAHNFEITSSPNRLMESILKSIGELKLPP